MGCSTKDSLQTEETKTQEIAEEQWNQAEDALRKDSSLMSSDLLSIALTRGAPTHILQFMLSINPKVVLPKDQNEVSALHVAIKHGSPLSVIRAIIEACPTVLEAQSKVIGEISMDPLSFAKAFRSEDLDLLDLLCKPLSFWMNGSNSNKSSNSGKSIPKKGMRTPSSLTNSEWQELDNMKKIVASLVRAQKRQLENMTVQAQGTEARLDKLELVRPSKLVSTTKEIALRAQLQLVKKKSFQKIKKIEDVVANHEKRMRKVETRVALASQQLIHLDINHIDKEWMLDSKVLEAKVKSFSHQKEKDLEPIPFVYATPYDQDKDTAIELQLDEPLVPCFVPKRRMFHKIRKHIQRTRYFVPTN